MNETGLLFIPDISGYTKFINQTELDHSSHIISELLELILDNNTLNLQLAEVEGDALFMYCEDGRFTFEDIQAQTKKMFMSICCCTSIVEFAIVGPVLLQMSSH